MQVSLSTNSFFGLGKPQECINGLLDVGFKRIMPDLGRSYPSNVLEVYGVMETAYDIQKVKAVLDVFLEECTRSSLSMDVVRAPRIKWDTERTDINSVMLQTSKESIEACRRVNAGNVIIQPLFAGIAKQDIWQENYCYYKELGMIARKNGIRILLVNQCGYRRNRFVRGVCSDPLEASEWIDTLNEEFGDEVFGFCLDTCAGTLCRQDIGEMAVALGGRLKAVLLRECGCSHEMSGLPFMGMRDESTDWHGLMNGLRRIDFDGELILDAGDTLRNLSHLIRPHLYPLMRAVADYIGWQVELEKRIKRHPRRVLFGAGRMCENYMICYGEEYPPLFICDNNPKLWGTKLYGLEVRSPEALKKLQEECAVIICNTFYEEIAGQLREMGIEQIETFNDEYLPYSSQEINRRKAE